MTRFLGQACLAVALIGAGWAAARAQAPAPAFELQVDVSGGGTTISCLNGCLLAWVERGVNPHSRPIRTFEFSCNSITGATTPCSSGKVGGWLH